MEKNKKVNKTGFEVITLRYSFHGRTHLTTTLTGQSKYKKGMAAVVSIPGIKIAPAPYCYRCPFNIKQSIIYADYES